MVEGHPLRGALLGFLAAPSGRVSASAGFPDVSLRFASG